MRSYEAIFEEIIPISTVSLSENNKLGRNKINAFTTIVTVATQSCGGTEWDRRLKRKVVGKGMRPSISVSLFLNHELRKTFKNKVVILSLSKNPFRLIQSKKALSSSVCCRLLYEPNPHVKQIIC